MQQVERLPQFAHVADQPLGVLPMRLDAAFPPPPPPSRAVGRRRFALVGSFVDRA